MTRTGKTALYGIYTTAAVVFFLYVLFPSEVVRDFIFQQIEQAQPDIDLNTDTVTPVLPLGLKLTPLAIGYGGKPLLRADYLEARPYFFSLFQEIKKFDFDGPLGNGSINGHAELILDPKRPQTKIILNLAHIPIEMVDLLTQWPGFKPSGEMNADIDFDSRKGTNGSATVNLELAQGAIVINPPLLGLERLEFSQVRAQMTVTQRMLQIRQCEVSGPQIESKVSGSIVFRHPLGNSRITLSCMVKPQPAFIADHKNDMIGGLLGTEAAQKRGLVFRISGTLDNPNYVMR